MPPKAKKLPAPIDRPLSRAYLREFSGWSTAFSPGLSESTSLRVMENTMINRDGSLRVRPGMRYLSYATPPVLESATPGVGITIPGVGIDVPCVGSHEAFFLNDGTKAYLFAVREADQTVGFRVLALARSGAVVNTLTQAGFTFPQGETALRFTAATTYVKYLQIDNKIFALSDAGETLRIFGVGEVKTARGISSLEVPLWNATDKLTVVKPDAPWITGAVPISARTNLVPNPSFETNTTGATPGIARSRVDRVTTPALSGGWTSRLWAEPARQNFIKQPLHNVAVTGLAGWATSSSTIAVVGTALRCTRSGAGASGNVYYCRPGYSSVVAGQSYDFGFELVGSYGLAATNVLVRWYNSTSAQIGADKVVAVPTSTTPGWKAINIGAAPAGAVLCATWIRGTGSSTGGSRFDIKNVLLCKVAEATTPFFTGDSGANYSWVGTPNASESIYNPPTDAQTIVKGGAVIAGTTYTASAYVRQATASHPARLSLVYLNSAGAIVGTFDEALTPTTGGFVRRTVSGLAPAGAASCEVRFLVQAVGLAEFFYLDAVQVEAGASATSYFDSSFPSSGSVKYTWASTAHASASVETTLAVASTIPAAETNTANTLISSTTANNKYNFGYYYTFTNEVGESAPSQVMLVRAQRPFSAWKWEGNTATGEPNGTEVTDGAMAADQLVAYMPAAVYTAAKNQGASAWNLYMLAWSDQDPVPPEGILVESKKITAAGTHGTEGWIRHTPANIDGSVSTPLPSEYNRVNYSEPSTASQGLVAADRMVLVNDPADGAKIRWSSSQMGEYSNFTASKGGGFKTLTSGNLFVPATVKLWQNPQSADTLTVLCLGVDGYSASYYMAPASITSQTDSTQLMGFEETTATPGTSSPFGVEVMNNALYHPLETELMKSTAANYNINHKTMTELISNMWVRLQDKAHIVSSQLDNRMYLLVNNPSGAPLEAGCWGNELWIFDAASETGTWSRWLVQGQSLRKIEFGGRLLMSLVRPDGIYCFDDALTVDEFVSPSNREVHTRPIPWKIETNTQGANRAHDAWAHLQQVNVTFGSFSGKLRFGVRGFDLHGRRIDISKETQDENPAPTDGLPWDFDDMLQVRRDMKEWRFFAESMPDEQSSGQINLVQYRYTPVSVNVGYEFGSVETFEYARNVVNGAEAAYLNGLPAGAVDASRP